MSVSHRTQLQAAQKINSSRQLTQPSESNLETRRENRPQTAWELPLTTYAPPEVEGVLRTPGKPLNEEVQHSLGRHFMHDFSQVRIHADPQAAESAKLLQAQAYTAGKHIVFAPERYAPQTPAGRLLLAHELVHTIQQSTSMSTQPIPLAAKESQLEQQAMQAVIHPEQSLAQSPYAVQCANDAPQYQQVAGITTPQPVNVQINPNGTTTQTINGLVVIFERDQTSNAPELRNKAETKFRFDNNAINYQARNGRVTSFTGPGQPRVRIRTTYGQGVSASSPSAYGRGTTAADIAAGSTSLGFHEGRHGLDYVAFFQSHPFPQFTGTVGMSESDFQDAITNYLEARRQYMTDLEQYSITQTDCVGTTIDELNAQHGEVTAMCQATP